MPAKINLAPCYQCGGDATKCDCHQKLKKEHDEMFIVNGICPECLSKLPAPVQENREGGHSELVTYCPSCGATYTE